MQGTPLYAEASGSGMTARFNSDYSEYVSGIGSKIPDSIRLEMTADRYSDHSVYIKDAPAKLAELAKAYRSDLEGMTAEQFRTAEIYGYLSYLPVYDTCTATIALLTDYGMKPFQLEERTAARQAPTTRTAPLTRSTSPPTSRSTRTSSASGAAAVWRISRSSMPFWKPCARTTSRTRTATWSI